MYQMKDDSGRSATPLLLALVRSLRLRRVCLTLLVSGVVTLFLVITRPAAIVDGYVVAGAEPAASTKAAVAAITNAANVAATTIVPENVSYPSPEQERRQNLIASVCSRHERLRTLPRSWRYKMDRRHGLIYCPIPKAGWSSWKRLLFYINGAINSTDEEIGIAPDTRAGVVDLAFAAVEKEVASAKTSPLQQPRRPFLFVFVRDPWRRLVSAYINKALDWNYTRILHTPCSWESMEPYREPLTFAQFLACIADGARQPASLDIHWAPMWQLCDFCRLRYDYVGHMETIADDADYVVQRNGLNATFPRIFSSRAHSVDDVLVDWYRSVPADVLRKLRDLYAYDIELHGYSDAPPGWEGRLS